MQRFIITIVFTAIILVPFTVFAQQLPLGQDRLERAITEAGYDPATSETSLAANLGLIVRIALSFLGVMFMILIIYAGFLWMNARGNETDIEKAQEIIRAAVIGLIIVVSAYSITYFVVPRVIDQVVEGG